MAPEVLIHRLDAELTAGAVIGVDAARTRHRTPSVEHHLTRPAARLTSRSPAQPQWCSKDLPAGWILSSDFHDALILRQALPEVAIYADLLGVAIGELDGDVVIHAGAIRHIAGLVDHDPFPDLIGGGAARPEHDVPLRWVSDLLQSNLDG